MCEIHVLTTESMILRILVSLLLGGILGFERGLKNRPAGFRTYILVCVSACIVMITNQYVYQAYNTGDPVRMAAQVISGIGFLGAGTIIVTQRNQIKGLTTAAGLWAAACLGLAVGIGLFDVGIIGGLAIFLVLNLLNRWDFVIRNRTRSVDLYVELSDSSSIPQFSRSLRAMNIMMSNIQLEHENICMNRSTAFICTVRGTERRGHDEMLRMIRLLPGIVYVEEL